MMHADTIERDVQKKIDLEFVVLCLSHCDKKSRALHTGEANLEANALLHFRNLVGVQLIPR